MNIEITPARNWAPVFDEGLTAVRSAASDATIVGLPLVATDVDGDTLTYSLSDTIWASGDAAKFSINSRGQITRNSGTGVGVYAVTVGVSDGEGAMASLALTITISATDPPPLTGPPPQGPPPPSAGTPTATYNDNDNDNDNCATGSSAGDVP